MKLVVARIAPWQAGKVFSVLYFGVGLLVAIPMVVFAILFPTAEEKSVSITLFVLMPFLYAGMALVFIPLLSWAYNKSASMVGGLEVQVRNESE